MRKMNPGAVLVAVVAVGLLVSSVLFPAKMMADEVTFDSVGDDMSAADNAFGMGQSDYSAQDAAFAAPASMTATVEAAEVKEQAIDYLSAAQQASMGSLPPSLMATMTYEQYESYRRQKAEAYALTDSSYGTAEYVPARQIALEKVVQQAKDMQYSQEMVDEIAAMFRLHDYIDYDYHVVYGKNPDNFLRMLREQNIRERKEREARRRAQEQLARAQRKHLEEQARWESKQGITVDEPQKQAAKPEDEDVTFGGEGGVVIDDNGRPVFNPTDANDDGYNLKTLSNDERKRKLDIMMGNATASEIPEDVVASIEANVHNAILEKLKEKGYDVAALNVFLQNLSEIKVIAIITTSDLPKSAIRSTLRDVRGMIENEVLARKFRALRLAQLSSFTILNEIDNTFYEHPVLYWQMQLTGWDAKGRRISPGTPSTGDVLPQADTSAEADALLEEFIGN